MLCYHVLNNSRLKDKIFNNILDTANYHIVVLINFKVILKKLILLKQQ